MSCDILWLFLLLILHGCSRLQVDHEGPHRTTTSSEAKIVCRTLQAWRNHCTATTRWSHCWDHVNALDIPVSINRKRTSTATPHRAAYSVAFSLLVAFLCPSSWTETLCMCQKGLKLETAKNVESGAVVLECLRLHGLNVCFKRSYQQP